MKKLLFIIFAVLVFTFAALAQVVQTTLQNNSPKRPNLMAELGLSTEQIQQIRKINKEQKPKMETAQRSFREARKSLDEAIYAETFNELDLQAKTKEVQAAQNKVTAIKTETEFAVRKILTAEQLVIFRELRQRLMQGKLQNRPLIKQLKQRFSNRQQ